jgi:hypothetical protein
MIPTEEVVINDKKYIIQKLDMFEALKLQLRVVAAFGALFAKARFLFDDSIKKEDLPENYISDLFMQIDPEKIAEIMPIIFGRITAPGNISLNDLVERERWFAREENKGDVWPLFLHGMFSLVGEYLPNSISTLIQNIREMMKNMNQLKSQTDMKLTDLSQPQSKRG